MEIFYGKKDDGTLYRSISSKGWCWELGEKTCELICRPEYLEDIEIRPDITFTSNESSWRVIK